MPAPPRRSRPWSQGNLVGGASADCRSALYGLLRFLPLYKYILYCNLSGLKGDLEFSEKYFAWSCACLKRLRSGSLESACASPRPYPKGMLAGLSLVAAAQPPTMLASLDLQGCSRLFIDGGSNDGDSVRSFLSGGFFRCALNGPHRLYNSAWPNRSVRDRRTDMAVLNEPGSFCIRSFEANPKLLPLLRTTEAELGSKVKSLRFVDGALGNVTRAASSRKVVTYAHNKWGSTATTFDFFDIHAGKPQELSSEIVSGPSYDVLDVLRDAFRLNSGAVVALKLDVEGLEGYMLNRLASAPELLCGLSYLFVEFHHLPNQRVNLTNYGLLPDLYEDLKTRIHAQMEQPGCKLKVYWRSFWSACGDVMRFQWRSSEQATDKPPAAKGRSRRVARARRRSQ